ncbi:hypothetical protein SODG_006243 [Sodalis praecaptivus]
MLHQQRRRMPVTRQGRRSPSTRTVPASPRDLMQRLGQLNDARFDMVRRDGVKTEPKEQLWGICPEKVGFTRLNQHPRCAASHVNCGMLTPCGAWSQNALA